MATAANYGSLVEIDDGAVRSTFKNHSSSKNNSAFRPRRPDPASFKYLYSLPDPPPPLSANFQSTSVDPHNEERSTHRALSRNALKSLTGTSTTFQQSGEFCDVPVDDIIASGKENVLPSLACENGGSQKVEALIRSGCSVDIAAIDEDDYSEEVVASLETTVCLLSSLTGYWAFLSSNRYASRVVETVVRCCYSHPLTLNPSLKAQATKLSETIGKLLLAGHSEYLVSVPGGAATIARHVCGSQVLRTLAVTMAGGRIVVPTASLTTTDTYDFYNYGVSPATGNGGTTPASDQEKKKAKKKRQQQKKRGRDESNSSFNSSKFDISLSSTSLYTGDANIWPNTMTPTLRSQLFFRGVSSTIVSLVTGDAVVNATTVQSLIDKLSKEKVDEGGYGGLAFHKCGSATLGALMRVMNAVKDESTPNPNPNPNANANEELLAKVIENLIQSSDGIVSSSNLKSLALDCGPSSHLTETIVSCSNDKNLTSIVNALLDADILPALLVSTPDNSHNIGSYVVQAILERIDDPELSLRVLAPLFLLIGKCGWGSTADKVHMAVVWKALALASRAGPHVELVPKLINAIQQGSGVANAGAEDILLSLLLKADSDCEIDICGAKAYGALMAGGWNGKFLEKAANSPLFGASDEDMRKKKKAPSLTLDEAKRSNLLNNIFTNGGLARCIVDPILDMSYESDIPHAVAVSLATKLAKFGTEYDDETKIGIHLVNLACSPVGSKLLKKISTVLIRADEKAPKEVALSVAHNLATRGGARLRGDRFGRTVIESCGVARFESGEEEWSKFCKSLISRTKFLNEVVTEGKTSDSGASGGSGNGNGNGTVSLNEETKAGRKRKRKRKKGGDESGTSGPDESGDGDNTHSGNDKKDGTDNKNADGENTVTEVAGGKASKIDIFSAISIPTKKAKKDKKDKKAAKKAKKSKEE